VPLLINQFVGYTIGALSIEFNTVFLHLRFLFLFCNPDAKSALKFKLLAILNLGSLHTICFFANKVK
jgi:hypothetical protein